MGGFDADGVIKRDLKKQGPLLTLDDPLQQTENEPHYKFKTGNTYADRGMSCDGIASEGCFLERRSELASLTCFADASTRQCQTTWLPARIFASKS